MLFVTPDNWINPINAYGSTGWVDTLDIDKIKNDDQKPKPTVGGDKENKNKFKNKDTMTKTFEHWLNYVKKGKKINESVTDNTTLDKLQAYISENPISDQAHTEEDLHDITMQLFANLDITGAHQDVVDKAKDLVANNISLMYDRSVIGDRNLNWQANLDNKHNEGKYFNRELLAKSITQNTELDYDTALKMSDEFSKYWREIYNDGGLDKRNYKYVDIANKYNVSSDGLYCSVSDIIDIVESKRSNVNKEYTHFAISKETGKIVTGWETVSDVDSLKYYANIDLKDMDLKPSDYKILSAKALIRNGIDPYDWNSWAKTGEKKYNENNNMKNLEVGQCYSIYDIQNNGKILYQFAEYKGEKEGKFIFTMINTKTPNDITLDNLDQYMFIKKQPLKKAA